MKTISSNNPQQDSDNPAMQSMQTMNTVMPLMIGFMAFSMPAGLGLYWIATAVCATVQQLALNWYFGHMDLDGMVSKNLEKYKETTAKKAEIAANKPESSIQKIVNDAKKNNPKAQEITAKLEAARDENLRRAEEIREMREKATEKKSLASRANMVADFNEKNKK